MMKITLQNNKYVATAISNVTGVAIRELVYMADPEDNLVITHPENVDISSVESEISNVKTTMDLNELRTQRDKIIARTDWWMMPDRTATDEQIAYRQALRDITDTYTSLEDVVWPTPPA
jgi:hypothetical protein